MSVDLRRRYNEVTRREAAALFESGLGYGLAARIWGALRLRSATYACVALLVGLDQACVVEACLERSKVVVVRMGAGNLEVPDEHLRALGLRTIWVSIG